MIQVSCNTLEAGYVRYGWFGYEGGQGKIGFMLGGQDIHNISALSVSDVDHAKRAKPVHIEIDFPIAQAYSRSITSRKIKGSVLSFRSVIARCRRARRNVLSSSTS